MSRARIVIDGSFRRIIVILCLLLFSLAFKMDTN
ncbi:hypothetical protein D915_007633 [Fasciola hepatica]|uniref:Uncharacterized protein n=1 Tax=Fasciola hepatica TaxID=6192 RepID=A0A4E0R7A0_FASHE|nr:hypothetical protein D915_007633 [Fasciola hepatica]